MKNIITTILILIFALSIFAANSRPTNEWEFIFNDNQTAIFEAENIDDALFKFRREYHRARIFSVAQRSYVESIWIWK